MSYPQKSGAQLPQKSLKGAVRLLNVPTAIPGTRIQVSDKAWQVVRWYQAHWIVEQLFRVMKSHRLQLERVLAAIKKQDHVRVPSHTRHPGTELVLPIVLGALTFRSNNQDHRLVLDALALVRRHLNSKLHCYPLEEFVPLDGVVPIAWRDAVIERDAQGRPRINRITYEICALQALREQLRCKEIWVEGAEAELALTELDYLEAARLFGEAASLAPNGESSEKGALLTRQADALLSQGDERGDNTALQQAIRASERVLELWPRERVPLDWAATQMNLGNALQTLGGRESGTARLEEAVAAYRAALEEGSSVRPIVISFSSFTPASTRAYGDDRQTPAQPRTSS